MPIPPRPIPARATQRQRAPRPGSSVPRKSLPTTQQHLDWRAEVALLAEMGPRSVPGKLGSLRSPSSGGADARADDDAVKGQGGAAGPGGAGRREVCLEGLIADGRGKREKRTTTATTLGFDFIPNPSVVALPDEPATAQTKPRPTHSLLTASRAVPAALGPHTAHTAHTAHAASPGLAGTPTTPALLASPSPGSDESDADEFDDWEHISSFGGARTADAAPSSSSAERDENVDSDGEEDVIVLGEMDLEDELDGRVAQMALDRTPAKASGRADPAAVKGAAAAGGKGKGKSKGKSYAAVALGA